MVKLLDLNLPPPTEEDDEPMETLDSVSPTTIDFFNSSSTPPPPEHNESSLELSLMLHFQEDYNQQSSTDAIIFSPENEVTDFLDDNNNNNSGGFEIDSSLISVQGLEEDFMPIDSIDDLTLDPYFLNDVHFRLSSLFEETLGFLVDADEVMVETRGEDDTTGILNLDFFDSEFFDYLDGAELHFPGFMEEEEDHVIGGTTIPSETKFIENLPLHSLTRDDIGKINVCAVCMDEFIVEEKVTFLPCLHYFHGNCVLPWLNIHNTCPLCRFEFPS